MVVEAERSDLLPNVKRLARLALGGIWLYQGIVPKLLAAVPLELEVVERTGLYLGSPRATMVALGVGETLLGLWLVSGWRERAACAVTSGVLVVLSALVVIEEPSLLLGPFGGLIKNAALFACAWIVWRLSPETS
ncbi:MAG: DoxX family protein [Acidobacteria bacterium]|nr:MAG: DoxX family protein [Acidobacteriota bacterium]